MMYEYRAKLVRVIDGDTVVLDVDLGWNVWLRGQHCRLLGIDAPERYTDAGKRSKEYLDAIIGTELTIKTDVDKTCSFKRMLVTLFRDGRNLNDQMVESGNAKVRA
jgi:micrococcal nuclease